MCCIGYLIFIVIVLSVILYFIYLLTKKKHDALIKQEELKNEILKKEIDKKAEIALKRIEKENNSRQEIELLNEIKSKLELLENKKIDFSFINEGEFIDKLCSELVLKLQSENHNIKFDAVKELITSILISKESCK